MPATGSLPRSTPETQGIASSAILEFVARAESSIQHLHSFVLMRHGHVIAEGWWSPYAATRPHMLFSLSKSFTSTAIGMAVDEGRLSLDDKVVSFFPDDAPVPISANLAAMRVRDLLTMTAGHAAESLPANVRATASNWVRTALTQPVEHAPGTKFVYNSGATYLLSAILHKVSGQRLLDYLTPRLFAPLGIASPRWEQDPRGIDVGGWGLNVTTEDIAKFGQLYLQRGNWHGAQLIPADWAAQATGRRVDNAPNPNADWEQGYGYQFWRCRHNAYRGDGAFGQFCIVMPEHDVVLAITSGVPDMQAVLNLVWETLLPAFASNALPADPTAQAALAKKLAALELPTAAGARTSPLAARIAGRAYQFESNRIGFSSARVDQHSDGLTLTLATPHGEDVIACGYGEWRESRIVFTGERHGVSSGSYAWSDDTTLNLTLYLSETPFVRTHTLRFDGDSMTIETRMNVEFVPPEPITVIGRAIP